jgi:hypothetical protein
MSQSSIDKLKVSSPIPRSARWQASIILAEGNRDDQLDAIVEAGLDNSGHLFAPKSVTIGFKTKLKADQWVTRYRLIFAAKTGVAGFGDAQVRKLSWFNLRTCKIT